MASVNKIHLLGNCGKDPEVRFLASGMAVTTISLATTSKRKDKSSGETIEETQWHRVQFFDRLAEIVGEYVKKGSPVYIEGRLRYGKFKNKDGFEQNTCDIIASELQLLGTKPQGQQEAPRAAPAPRPSTQQNSYAQASGSSRQPAANTGSGFDDMDDDIPF